MPPCGITRGISWVLALAWMGVASNAWASRLMAPRDSAPSPRATGMGGAAVAISDDGDAIFQNPAGIGREDGDFSKNALRGFSFPNATFGANKYTLGMYKDYEKSDDRPSAIEKTILSASEKDVVYGHVSAFPYITLWRFQLGVLTSAWGEGSLTHHEDTKESAYSTPSEPLTYTRTISAQGLAQIALVAGFSLPYKKTGLSLGVTGRFAYRNSFQRDIEATETSARKSSESYRSDLNATKGAAADVGLLYQTRAPLLPSFGLVVRDVGDTWYAPLKSTGETEIEKMNIAAGVAIRPDFGKSAAFVLGVDVQRIHDSRLILRDKVKMGFELGLGASDSTAPFSLRGGYNLRAPSVGIGAHLLFLNVDVSYAGEAVEGGNGTRVDMRSLVRASVDLRL